MTTLSTLRIDLPILHWSNIVLRLLRACDQCPPRRGTEPCWDPLLAIQTRLNGPQQVCPAAAQNILTTVCRTIFNRLSLNFVLDALPDLTFLIDLAGLKAKPSKKRKTPEPCQARESALRRPDDGSHWHFPEIDRVLVTPLRCTADVQIALC